MTQFQNYTLFLDRDGVINERPMDDYVKTWDDFHFLPVFLDVIGELSHAFCTIIIISNQQGIGKNLMSEADLFDIHSNMKLAISGRGGRIDAIFYCPHLAAENCACRKPKTGMVETAKDQFPDIDFKRSIFIGDTETDLQLAKSAEMISVVFGGLETELADYRLTSWDQWAETSAAIQKQL